MSADPDAGSGSDCNDFVIRDGFPALRRAKDSHNGGGGGGSSNNNNDRDDATAAPRSVWHIDGPEPLPRHAFWGCRGALAPRDAAALAALRADCRAVFAARARAGGEAYSAGVTYFCPALLKPRCALEALALEIFRTHTRHLADGVMVPEQSGAEWWTLVLDEDGDGDGAGRDIGDDEEDESDEVGLHFDADYGLEEQTGGLLLHPRLATVTYLSDYGAPTVVFERRSPPPNDADKKSLEGPIHRGWLTAPAIGKHIAFDGRLLHGAPATFFPAAARASGGSGGLGPAAEPPQKRTRLEPCARYTFLVNVWINHCPLDAEPLDEEVCSQLSAPPPSADGAGGPSAAAYTWEPSMDLAAPTDCLKARLAEPGGTAEPAGEEEFVLGKHLVTCMYAATMEDLHRAAAAGAEADFVELDIEPGAVALQVREYIERDNDDSEE